MSFVDTIGPFVFFLLAGLGLLALAVSAVVCLMVPWAIKTRAAARHHAIQTDTTALMLNDASRLVTELLLHAGDHTAAIPDELMDQLIDLHQRLPIQDLPKGIK